ncbi:rRNA large subunit pseudouridine synthase E [Oceaniserpentilla sp. 4NH20-0058]|uniref:pseudouridine synthase n=1 Tax=Oceaniserpentilla sp. 4NH20-0058 TaxID=3127660 RepID=UPI00310B23C0
MAKLILFNKPFKVMSQFSSCDDKKTLANFINIPNIYPAGRLDYDSEGLLLLTDNGQLQHQIAHPNHKAEKTYWTQVEGAPTEFDLDKLRNGVLLKDGLTQPAKVKIINEPEIWQRTPPIRERANIPTTWLEIIISEGKNRQVRRMTAAIGHPTLRLIRSAIGEWTVNKLNPGEFTELTVDAPVKKRSYQNKGKFGKMRPPRRSR